MTLPPVLLDDLTFEELLDSVRRRIPAESGGRWTLHAPVDPGITLLELFGYLLEQRLYWLDQVPDAVVRGVLRLLGVPGPAGAVPAATVLGLRAETAVTVPAGTGFSRDPLGEIVFSTDDTMTVQPVGPVAVAVDGTDVTADLERGVAVPLFTARGGPGSLRLQLLPGTGTPVAGSALALLLRLDATATAPSWAPDAAPAVGPPARLRWSYGGPGGLRPFPADDVDDGTGGLRRSGVVRLRLPDDWAGGAAGHEVEIATDRATFAFPPRLLEVVPNAVPARHRYGREYEVSLPDPPLPCASVELPGVRGRLLDAGLTAPDGTWVPTADLAFHGPGDQVFTLDRAAGLLRFGDGFAGRLPTSRGTARAHCTLGGGTEGNGGTSQGWFPANDFTPPAGTDLTVANVVPAQGGRDPETVAAARERAAAVLAEPDRAVTAADTVRLATTTAGVAVRRAYAGVGEDPGHPCVRVPDALTVRIVPHAPRADTDWERGDFVPDPVPDPAMIAAVRARLEGARLLGTRVFVTGPRYRRVRLRVEMRGPVGDAELLSRVLRARLRRHLDPLSGGPDEDGWPFGDPVRPTGLLQVALDAVAESGSLSSAVTAVAVGLDGAEPLVFDRDLPLGSGELPVFDGLVLAAVEGDGAGEVLG
ncbi:hypothetical protein ACFW93_32175 [Streptomyces canus]|uniref:hypothetical protein n=1 Tax=Streptomyces canus TaxID=58343 RepID=UPI003697AC87